jgi:hypothetical protein
MTDVGQSVVMTFESGREVKFVKTDDWYNVSVATGDGLWEPIDFPKMKEPKVEYRVIGGIPVTIGMSSNDFVEMCMDMPAYHRHDR